MTDDLWMQTVSGRKFVIADPDPASIVIEDIAHALSMLCRFGGQTLNFYSVAQHSVHVCDYVETALNGTPNQIRWALLHDASEAYLGDVIWPLKKNPALSGYTAIEARVQAVIADRFLLGGEEPACVKMADLVMLATEKRDLMANGPGRDDGAQREADAARITRADWNLGQIVPRPERIDGWSSKDAAWSFMQRFKKWWEVDYENRYTLRQV